MMIQAFPHRALTYICIKYKPTVVKHSNHLFLYCTTKATPGEKSSTTVPNFTNLKAAFVWFKSMLK